MSKTSGSEGNTLVALFPILYRSRQYQIGDKLPTNNPDMVNAWIEAGTAKWVDATEADTPSVPAAKAVPKTAEPGLGGQTSAGTETDGDDLVGKVPKTSRRKK